MQFILNQLWVNFAGQIDQESAWTDNTTKKHEVDIYSHSDPNKAYKLQLLHIVETWDRGACCRDLAFSDIDLCVGKKSFPK